MFDTRKFIKCVQGFPAIWNRSCQEYNDRNVREESWNSIGGVMHSNWSEMSTREREDQVREMKGKWRHIRDNFCKYLNRKKRGRKNGDLSVTRRKYIYADLLAFVVPTFCQKSSEPLSEQDATTMEEQDEEKPLLTLKKKRKPVKVETSTPPKPTPLQVAEEERFFQEKTAPPYSASNMEDADRCFLLSLLPEMKKLNDEEKLDFRLHALEFFRNCRKPS